MSKPEMEVHEAIRKTIAHRWLIGVEIQFDVTAMTGKLYSESSITRRLREIKEPRYGGYDYRQRYRCTKTGRRSEYHLA